MRQFFFTFVMFMFFGVQLNLLPAMSARSYQLNSPVKSYEARFFKSENDKRRRSGRFFKFKKYKLFKERENKDKVRILSVGLSMTVAGLVLLIFFGFNSLSLLLGAFGGILCLLTIPFEANRWLPVIGISVGIVVIIWTFIGWLQFLD